MARPLGVTIIAILMAIGGVVMIVAGTGSVAVAPVLPSLSQTQDPADNISAAMLGGAAAASGAVMLALGVASLVIAYGLFKGRSWAWTAAVILSIIGVVLSVVSIVAGNVGGIVSLVIDIVILYYLYRPHVKAYFGKAASPTPPDAAAA